MLADREGFASTPPAPLPNAAYHIGVITAHVQQGRQTQMCQRPQRLGGQAICPKSQSRSMEAIRTPLSATP